MRRNIESQLLVWKTDINRKVLIVRGARQVGKTYSIRELGKTFKYFVEVNFEEDKDVGVFFRDSLNPAKLCEKLSAYFSTPIVKGETLLFFDEIQACPEALSSLRFFHEKMPALHVVGAGSLLELVIGEIPSFGVGRLSSLFIYPFTFDEYLMALGEEALRTVVKNADSSHPVDEPFHRRLVECVRTYQIVGGMPASVKTYVEQRNLPACFKMLDDLIVTFQDDFAKYRKKAPVLRLSEMFRAAAFQAGRKFKYANVDTTSYPKALKDALQLLVQAGLVYVIRHTHARGLPLGAQAEDRKFKLLVFDLGIYQRLLGLDIPRYLTANDLELVNKGSMAEMFVGLELVGNHPSNCRPALYYWHRETRASNAEVDYVIQQGPDIVPVEVKAGTKGQMQSMYLFMKERGLKRGIRVSLENFSRYDQVESVPLYAANRLCAIES